MKVFIVFFLFDLHPHLPSFLVLAEDSAHHLSWSNSQHLVMAEKTVTKSWADEEDDDDAPPGFGEAGAPSDAATAASAAAAAALKGLKVASGSKEEASAGRETKNDAEEGVIDQPDISIKTGQLNDVPDGSEHEIKSVSWDSDVQPERSMHIHFGGVLRTMKSFF